MKCLLVCLYQMQRLKENADYSILCLRGVKIGMKTFHPKSACTDSSNCDGALDNGLFFILQNLYEDPAKMRLSCTVAIIQMEMIALKQ